MTLLKQLSLPYFFLGIVLGLLGGTYFLTNQTDSSHPIGYADNDDEVHVHSDFIVYLDGQSYDFTDDKYQSKAAHVLHAHVHLHDNNDDVIHRHERDITLADFFHSLGFTLTDECITTDEDETFCSGDTQKLQLYVNGEATSTIADYENKEEDQLLLYYGDPADPIIDSLLSEVTDRACIYSGTCPERGVAPPEDCGLTCEL